MEKSFQDIAARIDNAYVGFAETLVRLGGVSAEIAPKLAKWYVAKKLAKVDVGVGRINVKHGAFLNKEAITKAVELMTAGE